MSFRSEAEACQPPPSAWIHICSGSHLAGADLSMATILELVPGGSRSGSTRKLHLEDERPASLPGYDPIGGARMWCAAGREVRDQVLHLRGLDLRFKGEPASESGLTSATRSPVKFL